MSVRLRRVGVAIAYTVLASGLAGAPAQAAGAGCHYKVLWPVAGVYEKPTTDDGIPKTPDLLKKKAAGDIVGNYCAWLIYNDREGRTYFAVHSEIADDDIGWMPWDAVTQV